MHVTVSCHINMCQGTDSHHQGQGNRRPEVAAGTGTSESGRHRFWNCVQSKGRIQNDLRIKRFAGSNILHDGLRNKKESAEQSC